MTALVTLLCPEGTAENAAPAHGARAYFPYALRDHPLYPTKNGGPYAIDVRMEDYSYFLGNGGFTVYEAT